MKSDDKRRIRIAHLQLLPLLTGVQRVTLSELVRLDKKEFERWIICKEPGPLSMAAQKAGISCLFVPKLTRPISPLKDLLAFFMLIRIFKKYNFDIVHIHSSKTGILGRVAARISGIPVIVHTIHGFSFPFASSRISKFTYYILEYLCARITDALIVLNHDDKNYASRVLKVPDTKLHVIPNGIDLDEYSVRSDDIRNGVRENITGVERDSIVVGMVGRLWEQKNPKCLLRAALKVIKTNNKVHFLFIGDGELRGFIEAEINKNNACQNIHIMGWRDDVPDLLAALDIFVLPSMWEGMPLAILEAMASSLPAIVSDISGNRELVINDYNGFVFPADDDIKLTELLNNLIKDEPLRERLGKNARKIVLEKYLLKFRIQRISDFYHHMFRSRVRFMDQ